MNAGSNIVGKSKHTEMLRKLTAKLAAGKADVLIVGERGVGKSMIALQVAANESVSTVSLSNIHETELEDELSTVSSGAVLLENLDMASFRVHDVVLKFVDHRPKGVRVIATISLPTKDLLIQRKLSENLCARINTFELVEIRPLRERPEDIPLLVKSFAKGMVIDINTLATLVKLPWQENISQLKSVIERCLTSMNDGRFILPEELVDDRTEVVKAFNGLMESHRPILEKSLDVMEKNIIGKTLERFGFNVSRAAEFLGMTEEEFDEKLSRIVAANRDLH